MADSSVQYIGDDLHVPVRVRAEAAALGDAIVVDDPQHRVAHVGRVVVVGEGEAVPAVEPAMVGVAAFAGGADGKHGGLRWSGPHYRGVAARFQGRLAGAPGIGTMRAPPGAHTV